MLIKELTALQRKNTHVVERYEESADFDADMDKLQKHLKAALAIMDSANFVKHVDDTEENFDVEGLRDSYNKLYTAIEEAINSAKDFYDTIVEAS